jgi:hypothetical protein
MKNKLKNTLVFYPKKKREKTWGDRKKSIRVTSYVRHQHAPIHREDLGELLFKSL